jgi:hypothetical protein
VAELGVRAICILVAFVPPASPRMATPAVASAEVSADHPSYVSCESGFNASLVITPSIGIGFRQPHAFNQLVFGNDEIRLRVLAGAAENELVDKCIN